MSKKKPGFYTVLSITVNGKTYSLGYYLTSTRENTLTEKGFRHRLETLIVSMLQVLRSNDKLIDF